MSPGSEEPLRRGRGERFLTNKYVEDLRTFPRDARRGWRRLGWRGIWEVTRVRTLDRVLRHGRLIVFEQRLDEVRDTPAPPGVRIEHLAPDQVDRLSDFVRATTRRRFEAALGAGRTCLVAWRGERPIGYTWISTRLAPEIETHPLPLPPDAAYLWDLYVVPEERNSGIGTALVSARLRRARELGFRRGWRAIAPGNRASLRVLEKSSRAEARVVGEIHYLKLMRRTFTRFHAARGGSHGGPHEESGRPAR